MVTLNISDLSVGDWVRYDGKEYQVQCVDGMSEIVTLLGYCEQREESAGNLRSIPITAEILEKNGFESTTKPNVFTLAHGEHKLYVSLESDGWYRTFVNFMERLCILQVVRQSYIHELQHALRLAGVDKEINL